MDLIKDQGFTITALLMCTSAVLVCILHAVEIINNLSPPSSCYPATPCQYQSATSLYFPKWPWVSGAAVIQVAKKIRLKLSFLGNSLNWSVSFDRMFGYKNEALASKAPSSLVWSVETGCGNSERQERLKFLWLNHYVNEAGAGETAFLSGRHHVVAEWLFKNETPVTATSPPGGGSLHTSSDRWKQMTESRFHMIDCVFYSLFALKRCQSGIWGLLYEHLHITRHTHTLTHYILTYLGTIPSS